MAKIMAELAKALTITRAELAKALRVHPKTVARWIQEGKIPPPLPLGGRTLRWRLADVARLLGESPDAA